MEYQQHQTHFPHAQKLTTFLTQNQSFKTNLRGACAGKWQRDRGTIKPQGAWETSLRFGKRLSRCELRGQRGGRNHHHWKTVDIYYWIYMIYTWSYMILLPSLRRIIMIHPGDGKGLNLRHPWNFMEFLPASSGFTIWVFPKIGVPQNGWFIMQNPIKMDDLGVPLFLETPIWLSRLIHLIHLMVAGNSI